MTLGVSFLVQIGYTKDTPFVFLHTIKDITKILSGLVKAIAVLIARPYNTVVAKAGSKP
jgi:hypothetical protein